MMISGPSLIHSSKKSPNQKSSSSSSNIKEAKIDLAMPFAGYVWRKLVQQPSSKSAAVHDKLHREISFESKALGSKPSRWGKRYMCWSAFEKALTLHKDSGSPTLWTIEPTRIMSVDVCDWSAASDELNGISTPKSPLSKQSSLNDDRTDKVGFYHSFSRQKSAEDSVNVVSQIKNLAKYTRMCRLYSKTLSIQIASSGSDSKLEYQLFIACSTEWEFKKWHSIVKRLIEVNWYNQLSKLIPPKTSQKKSTRPVPPPRKMSINEQDPLASLEYEKKQLNQPFLQRGAFSRRPSNQASECLKSPSALSNTRPRSKTAPTSAEKELEELFKSMNIKNNKSGPPKGGVRTAIHAATAQKEQLSRQKSLESCKILHELDTITEESANMKPSQPATHVFEANLKPADDESLPTDLIGLLVQAENELQGLIKLLTSTQEEVNFSVMVKTIYAVVSQYRIIFRFTESQILPMLRKIPGHKLKTDLLCIWNKNCLLKYQEALRYVQTNNYALQGQQLVDWICMVHDNLSGIKNMSRWVSSVSQA